MKDGFEVVGRKETSGEAPVKQAGRYKGRPIIAVFLLIIIFFGCFFCHQIAAKDPAYLDLKNCSVPPNREFLFGTDTLGRDLFSMIWYGGRVSLLIGIAATIISTGIGIIYGTVSGNAPVWADTLLMRIVELLFSIPNLLVVIMLQAAFGKADVFGISIAIGLTEWMGIAKVVRSEVRKLRESEYVIASKCMGGGFFHVLWTHLAPNFVPSVMFMAVMNIRNAILAESTLSFIGVGLPVETISWGSMLSQAEKALLTNSWWIILLPGLFLTVTLSCIASLGNDLRKRINRRQSVL